MAQFADASLSGVQALAHLAETVALQLSATMDSRDELLGLFGALHNALDRAISKAAALWNDSHDRSRVLPIELQEMCFLPLTVRQKCQLALVSSHWRHSTAKMPALWDHLLFDMRWKGVDLDAIIPRSGQLPLALEFLVIRQGLTVMDQCLRDNAHRIKAVSVSMEGDTSPHGTHDGNMSDEDDPEDGNGGALFNYPAPLLEELSLDALIHEEPVITNFSSIFAGHAPKLRSIRVVWTSMLAATPAFANVTTATIRSCRDGLSNIFVALPCLQHLELLDPRGALPALPAHAPLRTLKVDGSILSINLLHQLGYTRLTSITLRDRHDFQLIIDAAALFMPPTHTPLSSSLELLVTRSFTFEMRLDDIRTLRCTVHARCEELQRFICGTGTGAVLGLQRLILPRSLDYYPVTVRQGLPATLPCLRTLVVRCGEPLPNSLLSLEFLAAPIRVPALERLELVADPIAHCPASPIPVGTVVSFIRDVLELDNRASLDLFIDSAHGVKLVGDLAPLRACIGRLHI